MRVVPRVQQREFCSRLSKVFRLWGTVYFYLPKARTERFEGGIFIMMDASKYNVGYYPPPVEPGHVYEWPQKDHIEQAGACSCR